MRAELLLNLSKAFSEGFKYIDAKSRTKAGSFSSKHYNLKNHVLPSIINKYVDKKLQGVTPGNVVDIAVNRRTA